MDDTISQLTELLRELPGIGPRQARRLAFYLVRRDKLWVERLARTLTTARKETTTCTLCMRLFPMQSSTSVCALCTTASRDKHTLMIVEKDVDLENIERTGTYKGVYFVLGGTTSPLDAAPEKSVRLSALLTRVKDPALEEIIFACSATTEGEDTVTYIKEKIEAVLGERPVRLTLLGRGLSTGTELEYVDTDTMQNALRGRS